MTVPLPRVTRMHMYLFVCDCGNGIAPRFTKKHFIVGFAPSACGCASCHAACLGLGNKSQVVFNHILLPKSRMPLRKSRHAICASQWQTQHQRDNRLAVTHTQSAHPVQEIAPMRGHSIMHVTDISSSLFLWNTRTKRSKGMSKTRCAVGALGNAFLAAPAVRPAARLAPRRLGNCTRIEAE